MTNEISVQEAKLQDIPLGLIQESLANIAGYTSKSCDAEYGFHRDTDRLVLHFFPPGYAADPKKRWPDWTAFRDRLERALLASFDVNTIEGDYAEELHSFHISTPRPVTLDFRSFIAIFFVALESEP